MSGEGGSLLGASMTVLSLGLLAQYFFSSLIIPILISFIQCFAKHLGTPCCVILNISVYPDHSRSHCTFTLSVPSLHQPVCAGPARKGCHPSLCPGAGRSRLCVLNAFTRDAAAVLCSANTQEHQSPLLCSGVRSRGLGLVLPAVIPESTSPEGSFSKCLWCRCSW